MKCDKCYLADQPRREEGLNKCFLGNKFPNREDCTHYKPDAKTLEIQNDLLREEIKNLKKEIEKLSSFGDCGAKEE